MFGSLQPEIGGMFADNMDVYTLTMWRLTCKANYHQGSASLRRTLVALLRHFVPFPSTLIAIMRMHHAIFGGELALAFFLRDDSYIPADLEIFTTEFEFDAVCNAIVADPHVHSNVHTVRSRSNGALFTIRRLVSQTFQVQLVTGKSIYVHRSYTCSAASPLTRSPCTALSNFVTPYSFGCSHPTLTLSRRALMADQEPSYLLDVDMSIMNHLRAHQFSLAVSPSEWPEYCSVGKPRCLS